MAQHEFIHGLQRLQIRHRGCVATIGSFDGVHRGHQVILQQVLDKAKEMHLPSLAIVFEPQPAEFFSSQTVPVRIMRLRDKISALFELGIERVLCLKFNRQLCSLSSDEFIDRVLVDGIGVKHLVIGDDFRFGSDRGGDFALLRKAGVQHGFSICDTRTETDDGDRISSTRIRQLFEQDRLKETEKLLGRAFAITGRVIYGKQLGRTLGFPTVNIALGRYRCPVQGVYAVEVYWVDMPDRPAFQGVSNVGVRPTIDGGAKPVLEVHLFDTDQQLYGKMLRVVFRKKLRQEMRFESLDSLTAQIQRDVILARASFEGRAETNNMAVKT
ncbi:MAG: bifunctional riboflavin kinase/FMN adenylyltransferase [Alteromonadaceae bacterium]|nr:MAG: bifunctional riboflavin kinase/FMN adenylyltransferase [Alteromonadaceae bacterium]